MKLISSTILKLPAFLGITVLTLIYQSSWAAPNLQSAQTINGLTIFQDHQNSSKYYYLKSAKTLALNDEKPDFSYFVNRYIGNTLTGDSDKFWVRGAINFSVTAQAINPLQQEFLRGLRQTSRGEISWDAAPVANSYNKLVYALIDAPEGNPGGNHSDNTKGEYELGQSDSPGNQRSSTDIPKLFASAKQRFTLGLKGNDANLFWQNFERNNLSLSLAYGWEVVGVSKDINDEWVPQVYQVNNSLPIDISPTEYPDLFRKNELWQRLQFTHSGVKLMCYDFLNEELADLYYVLVELRFETLEGEKYTKQFRFKRDAHIYEHDIEFELANDIKQGYEYRVSRLMLSGERHVGDWQTAKQAWLDVSLDSAQVALFSLQTTNTDQINNLSSE